MWRSDHLRVRNLFQQPQSLWELFEGQTLLEASFVPYLGNITLSKVGNLRSSHNYLPPPPLRKERIHANCGLGFTVNRKSLIEHVEAISL